MLEQLFGIKTGFVGNVGSTAAKALGLKSIAADVNNKHCTGWQELCRAHGIANTPLTPFLDQVLVASTTLPQPTSLPHLGLAPAFALPASTTGAAGAQPSRG